MTEELSEVDASYALLEEAYRELTSAICEYEHLHGPIPVPPLSPQQSRDPRMARVVAATDLLRAAEAHRDAHGEAALPSKQMVQDAAANGGET